MDKIIWNFEYGGKKFENLLKHTHHGDCELHQNENSLHMDQHGEKYLLPIMIYGMQKIKSPEKTKKDLNKKDWIKKKNDDYIIADTYSYRYFQSIFTILDTFNEFKINNHFSRNKVIKIEKELKVFYWDKERMILPYSQLSKTIDKLICASKNGFFGSSHECLSEMIRYYVSGKFEKDHEKISNQIPL